MSISGKSVYIQSGDNRHQYDIWIKPETKGQKGTLQIYDAGLGGAVDLIAQETANTATTFKVFKFEDLYEIKGNSLESRSSSTTELNTLTANNEERFRNRWVPLADLNGSNNGYIVRVTTDEGDDINSYNLRVINSRGEIINGKEWKIITIDLSIGLYRSRTTNRFQIRPYILESGTFNPNLSVNGAEDSETLKIDSFGNEYAASGASIPARRFETDNKWGIQIKGSKDWLNTLTIYGTDKPVLWEFEPIVIPDFQKPELNIGMVDAARCTDKVFELTGTSFHPDDLRNSKWLSSNTQIASGATPTITFRKSGNIPVDILIPNEGAYFPQFWTYKHEVFVNTPPIAKLDVPKEIISPSETIILDASKSYDLEGKQIRYTWLVNNSRRGETGPTFSFMSTVSGIYNVSVQISDGGNSIRCSVAQRQIRIRVNTQPYAEIDYPEVSGTDEEITFRVTNQSDSDNDQLNYFWTINGERSTVSSDSVVISHPEPGFYDVALAVNDSSGANNSEFIISKTYEINAAPVPVFTIPEIVAPGDIFVLNSDSSSDLNNDELLYSWSVNGNEVANTANSTLSLDEPGDYKITLTVDDQRRTTNSVQELTKDIHVNAAPSPVITAVPMTSSSNVEFSAASSMDAETELRSFAWDFGDGNTATGPNVSHQYQSTGSYTVKLTVDDGFALANSVQSSEHVILVNSFPVASFTAPEVVAPGEAFTVDGTGSSDKEGDITKYRWSANNVAVGEGATNNITLDTPGLHTLTLAVNDNSGFDEAVGYAAKQIRVNASPVALWRTDPSELIPGQTIQFIASESYDPDGTVNSYEWEFEDGSKSTGAIIEKIFEDGGLKNFTLTITDNDGLNNSSTSIDAAVNVNHQPYIVTESVVRSNSLDVRLDASESYDLDENPVSFEWTLPDGSKRYESSFSWSAPEPGVHIVGLTVNDGLGLENSLNSESVRVLINRPVHAVVDSLITSCTGQTVLFNSSQSYDPDGDAFKVQWDFGDGQNSEEANPSYSYQVPGVYEAKLTLDDGFSGQNSVARIPVIIEGSPVAKFNISDTTICVNSSLDFDGTSSTDPSGSLPSFGWDFGDGNSATGGKYRHIFTEPGEYTVSLTVEGSGSGQCSNVSQVTGKVRVIEGPVAEFEVPASIAPGEPVTLDASASSANGGFRSAKWTIDTENSSEEVTGMVTEYTFTEPGEYFVTVTLETNTDTDCNTVSLTKIIRVNAPPVIAWQLLENIPAGSDLKLDALSSSDPDGFIKQFRWFLDDKEISTNATEIIKTVTPGDHIVRIEVKDNSPASNNHASMERSFFANSAPKPVINGPELVYQNEEVSLSTSVSVDKDGDAVSSVWKLDGTVVSSPEFTANEARPYLIKLIQNDGRGLPNSVDSTIFRVNPVKIPKINPVYPAQLNSGGFITISDLKINGPWKFIINGSLTDQWSANNSGNASFTLGWIPRGTVLSESEFRLEVIEPLKFTEEVSPFVMEWNPSNPNTILKAPTVNRDPMQVEITWKQNGQVIGKGLQLQTGLVKGSNTFSVEVRDLNVAQSSPITTNITVNTQ